MPVAKISEFTKAVIQNIKNIPQGRVATYKQIAELSGKPQASRGVSWILHSCATAYKLPWHRVLNSKGTISFEKHTHNYRQQKKRLEAEGVVFNTLDVIDLNQYRWAKKPKIKSAPKNKPQMFSSSKRES